VADETPAARIVGIALRHGGCVHCAAQSGCTSKRRRALREGSSTSRVENHPKSSCSTSAYECRLTRFHRGCNRKWARRAEAIQVISSFAGSIDERMKYAAVTNAEGRFKFEKMPSGATLCLSREMDSTHRSETRGNDDYRGRRYVSISRDRHNVLPEGIFSNLKRPSGLSLPRTSCARQYCCEAANHLDGLASSGPFSVAAPVKTRESAFIGRSRTTAFRMGSPPGS